MMPPNIRAAVLGSGYLPSLNLDFLSGTLDPRITFTRTSNASYFDASGVMQIAGPNVAAFSHDPATGAALGLRIEMQRANLLLNSATLVTQTVTVTAVATTLSFWGTGTVTLTGASTAGPLVGTGATQRVTLTFTPTAGSLTLTVSGSVQYANLEEGANATSWIQTTSAAATRTADSAVMTGANFSSWFNASAGTFSFDATHYQPAANAVAVQVDNGANTQRFVYNQKTNNLTALPAGNAIDGANIGIGIPAKIAFSYQLGNMSLASNGIRVGTSGLSSLPIVNRLVFGNAADVVPLNGYIRRLRYYPRALSDAALPGLTS